MTSTLTLLPSAAADRICHRDQMDVWSNDVAGALGLADLLRDDLSYDDVVTLHDVLQRELRSVIGMALDHSAVRAIYVEAAE
ncbi:MAG: hypothetical protein COC10_07465 [Sphingobium sp.]|jgi:hypothetical protein|nr:MAG: hypothetical protein COC10_07465 [Sphingobium sp.]